MPIEDHDLHHEFPELHDKIHQLKTTNNHFRKLFDHYHELTHTIKNMETEVTPVSTEEEETAKRKRLQLKDELYQILLAS